MSLVTLLVGTADKVSDIDDGCSLAMAINAAIALLQTVGVPGNLVVNEMGAVILQVNTFGSGIGGQQDTHGRFGRVSLECSFNRLSLMCIHTTVQRQQTFLTTLTLFSKTF